jgi:hypothetical protein
MLEAFIRENPHCRQARTKPICGHFAGEGELAPRPLAALPEFLGSDSPQIPFFDRPDADRSTLHFGQLKLALAEIQFLTAFCRDACEGAPWIVPYAGAAPGNHIPFLAALFPNCTFLLYDPAPFCDALRAKPPQNVRVFARTFFDEKVAADLAARYAGVENFAFICDIRTGKEESFVQEDMDRQDAWVRTMRPARSLLKFRLPWGEGTTEYLDGSVMLPVFGPTTTTECRLVALREHAAGPPRVYRNLEYERQCAYHNSVGRARRYSHEVALPGLDGCHDCATMVAVATRYLAAVKQDASAASVGQFIASLIDSFGGGRTLDTKYACSSNRSGKRHPRRTFVGDKFAVERPAAGRSSAEALAEAPASPYPPKLP